MTNHLNGIFSSRNYTYIEKKRYNDRERERETWFVWRSSEKENGLGNNECSLLKTYTSNFKKTREIINIP